MLGLVYVALALFGCGFILVAALTGFGGDGDAGGADGGDGAFHFPLFSPLTLAILFASIGAYGLITRYGFGLGDTPSILIATAAGLATAYAVGNAAFRLMHSARGTSAIRAGAFEGAAGEVITGIPAGGVGEVALLLDTQRFTGPARSADGRAIARGAAVTVLRRVGATLVVRAAEAPEETQ